MTKLIERNTTIPTSKTQIFSTAEDNQPAVTVRVFQGEREMAADNRLLGQFNLDGIPPAPRGVPQIEVTFDIDHNGILNVSARDKGTGKEQKIRIESSSGLSQAEVERMRREAEQYAAEDKRKRELAEARNRADQMCYQLEKMMKDQGDKLSEADKAPLTAAIAKVREKAKGDDTAAINQALQELETASHAMAQHLYKSAATAGAAPGSGPSPAQGKGKDDIIDADFEVKK
jgi:molecular chaperone DnaK